MALKRGDLNDRHSPAINVGLFAAFVAAGSGFIIYAKLWQFSALQVTLVPVSFMLAYATILTFARFFYLRDDQAGDNLYYMGFLFTLTSLAVSLSQFNATSGAEDIVHNFGIAIGSTIAGIALRIFFNQMRRDPVEIERAARLELADAARQVKRELDATVLEFSIFRRTAQQTLADSAQEVRENFQKTFHELFTELSELTKKSNTSMDDVLLRSNGEIEKLALQLRQQLEAGGRHFKDETEQLGKAATAFNSAVATMSKRLADMKTPEDVIEIKMAPAIQGLSRVVNTFATASNEQIKSLSESSDNLARGVGSLAKAISDFHKEAEQRERRLMDAVAEGLSQPTSVLSSPPPPMDRSMSAPDRPSGPLRSPWQGGSNDA